MADYGINAPQYQALDPDKMQTGLAQIAYGGNPIAAGLALSGENIAKEMRDNQYLRQLQQSNALAASLADRGMMNDRFMNVMQHGPNWQEKAGFLPEAAAIVGARPNLPLEQLNAQMRLADQSEANVLNTRASAANSFGGAYNQGLMPSNLAQIASGLTGRMGPRNAELGIQAAAAGNAGQYQQTNTETGSAIPVVDPNLTPLEKKKAADAIFKRYGFTSENVDPYFADVVYGKIKDDKKYTNQSKDKNAPPPGDKTKAPPSPSPPSLPGQPPASLLAERARNNLQYSRETNTWRNKTTGQIFDASGKPL